MITFGTILMLVLVSFALGAMWMFIFFDFFHMLRTKRERKEAQERRRLGLE